MSVDLPASMGTAHAGQSSGSRPGPELISIELYERYKGLLGETYILDIPDALLVIDIGLEELDNLGLGSGLENQRAALEVKGVWVSRVGRGIAQNSTWRVSRVYESSLDNTWKVKRAKRTTKLHGASLSGSLKVGKVDARQLARRIDVS